MGTVQFTTFKVGRKHQWRLASQHGCTPCNFSGEGDAHSDRITQVVTAQYPGRRQRAKDIAYICEFCAFICANGYEPGAGPDDDPATDRMLGYGYRFLDAVQPA